MDIIVVDDEFLSRRTIANTLRAAGYEVKAFDNSQEALKWLWKNPVQLVVCDRSMPGMDGLDLCRMIRKSILHRFIYIVMLTRHNWPQDVLDGLEAGADDCLTKSSSPADLVTSVNIGRRIIPTETRGLDVFTDPMLAESRDCEAGSHLERVQQYSFLLAQEMSRRPRFRHLIDGQFVRLIYDTSPLHDIGRVAISDAILLNPGRLTAEEFEVMKTHTLHGANTLAAAINEFPNAAFLQMAYDIALCHHERYNGRGYPRGLVGDDIPLSARIVALADVYDALSSERVYKTAMSHAEAKELIVLESGKHFDPDVVDAFVHLEKEFSAVREGAQACHPSSTC